MAEELAKIDNFIPNPVTKSFLQNTLVTNLRAYVTQHIPSNPQSHLPGLLEQIERIRSVLLHWIEETNSKEGISTNLIGQLSEAVSLMAESSKIFDMLKNNKLTIEEYARESQSDVVIISTNKSTIESQTSDSINLNNQIIKLHQDAENNTKSILDMVSVFSNLTSELNSNKQSQETLFKEFESYRENVIRLLEDTNRATMAASFITRKKELKSSIRLWTLIFLISIFALLCVASLLLPLIASNDWYTLIIKLPLTAPLVWLGWFSAKQYGYANRLREDYAYKAASAMAFEGYKREAADIDPELKKKLLETAISHLGDNPLRIFNDQENHASPLQEIIERSLKKEKVTDLLKIILSKTDSA